MNDTNGSAMWCLICGEPAKDVQVSTYDGWSEAAAHLVTIRVCTLMCIARGTIPLCAKETRSDVPESAYQCVSRLELTPP